MNKCMCVYARVPTCVCMSAVCSIAVCQGNTAKTILVSPSRPLSTHTYNLKPQVIHLLRMKGTVTDFLFLFFFFFFSLLSPQHLAEAWELLCLRLESG